MRFAVAATALLAESLKVTAAAAANSTTADDETSSIFQKAAINAAVKKIGSTKSTVNDEEMTATTAVFDRDEMIFQSILTTNRDVMQSSWTEHFKQTTSKSRKKIHKNDPSSWTTTSQLHREKKRNGFANFELMNLRLKKESESAQEEDDNNNDGRVECDPALTAVFDAGVLPCGEDFTTYCLESQESLLGGYCVTVDDTNPDSFHFRHHRQLQEGDNSTLIDVVEGICIDEADDDEMTCQNCMADNSTYTGSFDCTFTEYCFNISSLCVNGTDYAFCGSESITGSVTAPGSYTYKTWYENA